MEQRAGLRLKDYLICVAGLEALTPAELEQAFGAWQAGDERSRRLIEERSLARVVGWVLPYRGSGPRFRALIQAGNYGLLRALRQPPVARWQDLEEHLRQEVEAAVEALILVPRHP
jgi:DNA-directed RNA polymerase sigma subunit (sigma70/sigma32)